MEKCPLYVKSSEEQACGIGEQSAAAQLTCIHRNQSNFVFSNYFFLILGEWGGCSEQGPGDSAVLRPRG